MIHPILRCRLLIVSVAAVLSPTVVTVSVRADENAISFNDDIRPILNQHCVACHGGVKQAGGLSFAYADEASYVLEPGEPDESLIIERVTSEDEDEHMPPAEHGRALNDAEVAKLRRWIEQGGAWGQHWSFVAPQTHPAPQVNEADWVRGKIDAFVLDRLQKAELTPAREATPERWLRRVSLDLIGLPPTLQERRRFLREVEADSQSAYEAAVERLLDSPHFGERWASVWLDVVRYADSKGLGIDGRRSVWKFRDWVIKAFNADMPFDEFTVKQLAGDLLPERTIDDLVATACSRLTQTCEEGGTDDEQFRVEAVIDRVNTTMLAWQGLTFGCVQCHSHPYDPIRHEEYYQLLGFFNNTADSDLDDESPRIQVPKRDSDLEQALQLDREIEENEQKSWREAIAIVSNEARWSPLQDFVASTNNSTKVVVEKVDGVSEYQTRGNVAKQTTVVIESQLPGDLERLTAVQFTGLPKNLEQALIDSEWGFVLSHVKLELLVGDTEPKELEIARVIADEPNPILDPMLSLNAKSSNGFGAYSRIHYPRTGVFVLANAVELTKGCKLKISLAQNVFALGAFPLVAHRGRVAVTDSPEVERWIHAEETLTRAEKLADLRKQRSAIGSVSLPVMQERPSALERPTFVFDRGNYLTKADSVANGTPEFLPSLESQGTPTRLDFAKWLVSMENPLTARVAVNRFWAQLFGTGLVESQEDFGSSGDAPSHPLMFDDLSARFATDMGWSVKSLLREIVLSSTYRQSSVVDSRKLELDPQNRLLSRGPRFRMPAETIRDQALAISGLLCEDLFGEPVFPPIPDGVWLPFQGGDKWTTPDKGDPQRYRRTIYTYTKRTIQFPMMASFDAPTREFCSPRRLSSNTPLQALMTLNDATFVEASEALADRMLGFGDSPGQHIRHGVLLATCRKPTNEEVTKLLLLYEAGIADDSSDRAKKASLTTVATVLLNLDEVMNK